MKHFFLKVTCVVAVVSGSLFGQTGDLKVFGYFQASFNHTMPKVQKETNTFALQQLNLFFNQNLSSRFNAFVNFEMTNNYSSDNSWGYFNLDEAWMKYSAGEGINIQAGLLIPRYASLNTIKNKTPLLPYIFRPLVYESTISSILDFAAYLPEKAFVQFFGVVPVGDVSVDYALHIGNSERRYIAQSLTGIQVSGQDTTTFKSVGGRVGATWTGIRGGVSATVDRDQQGSLGNLPRTRLAFDAAVTLGNVTAEGEYIVVSDKVNAEKQAYLDAVAVMNPLAGNSLTKHFYYGNVTVELTDNIYTYAGYSFLDDKSNGILGNGVYSYTAGAGYRPVESVVVKAQWAYFKLKDERFMVVDQHSLYAAVSVLF